MSDVDIVLEIATKGVEDVYKLSNAMTQLNRAVNGVSNPMKSLDARSRALSQAVGSADSSLKSHAKTMAQLTRNQVILSNETVRVRKEIAGLGKDFTMVTGASAAWSRAGIRDLRNYESALKKVKVRALVEDLKAISQEQKRLGKDAQFVGRSLIIGLTTPIVAFGRFGLQALVGIDKEFVRLNKVLEGVAPNLDAAAQKMGIDLKNATAAQTTQLNKLVANYDYLDNALTKTSNKFGLAKSLTVGLAADFAELGIQSAVSIDKITELTASTEKLGNMDIGSSKQLVQSLYFQARRAMQQSGEASTLTSEQFETKAIAAATSQLNLFNIIENQTALSMKDLGDAFPEVAAAATTFGLSMTEAAGLLAPMKSAGMEVGASANAIKISLQSIVKPTKQTKDMFAGLTKEYGDHFSLIEGSGLDAIQALIDAYTTLTAPGAAAGQEGVLQFFSQVFGKRQSTRMLLPIQQLAQFDAVLKDTGKSVDSADRRIQDFANTAINSANKSKKANLPLINSYRDIGIIARIATAQAGAEIEGFSKSVSQTQIDEAIKVRNAVAEGIRAASSTEGIDLIGQTATESGKIAYIQLAGVKNAQDVADRELEASLGSLDTAIQRVKNSFKMFAADFIEIIAPSVKKLADFAGKMYEAWTKLDPATKAFFSKLTIAFAVAAAAIGPLIFVFGQFRLAIGSVGKVMFGFLPSLKTMAIESVSASSGLLRLTKPLTVMGDTVVNTSGKFSTFIATLAGGGGPLGKFADKIGTITGVLQKQTTANAALVKSIHDVQNARMIGAMGMDGGVFSPTDAIKAPIKRGEAGATRLAREARELASAEAKAAGPTRMARDEALKLTQKAKAAGATRTARLDPTTLTEKISIEQRRIAKAAGFSPLQIQESLAPKQRYKYASSIQAEMKRLQLDAAKAIGATDSEILEAFDRLNGKIKTAANKRMIDIVAAVNPKTTDFKTLAQASRKSARNVFEATETARRAPAVLMDSERVNAAQTVQQNAKAAQQARLQAQLNRQQQILKDRADKTQTRLQDQLDRQKQRIQDRLDAQQVRVQEQLSRSAGQRQLKLQQTALASKGIDFDKTTGIKTYKGRTISDDRAEALFRGSGRAKIAEAAGRAKETLTGKAVDAGGFAKAVSPVKAYKDSMAGARASVAALNKQHVDLGISGPSAIARMKVAMSGFTNATKIGTTAIKLLKLSLVASGIGIVLLAIGVAFILIKNNMDKFKEAGGKGLKVIGDAFKIVKNAAMEIVRPIVDLFAYFGSGSQGSAGAIEGIGNAFNKLSSVITWVANMFAMLVNKFVKPYMYMIINIVGAVVSLFQGNWKKAFSFLMAAVAFAVEFMVNVFATGFKVIVSLAGGLLKGIVSIIGLMGKGIIEGLVYPITAVLKVASMLPFGIGEKFKGINNAFRGVVNGAKGMVDSATGAVNGVIGTATKGTNNFIDSSAKSIKGKLGGLKKGGIDASTGKVSLLPKGKDEEELKVDTDPAQEKISNAVGEGIEDGADKGASALAKKLANYAKSLKEELQNAIQDRIKNKIKEVVDELTDGLKTQKETSLKVFDDQLEKIEEVAKAEERLTKAKEYENKKRELEEKRALNQLNSQRNYALAIYEGRIDDARQISLEQTKSKAESEQELKDLTVSREKELVDEKRQDLTDSIKKAKEESSKYFDEMIEKFTDAAKKITEFPPTTAAKFNEQLQLLTDAAKEYGAKGGDKFTQEVSNSLGDLGTDAADPLKTSLDTISTILNANNPFGPQGVWQTAIDDAIRDLTSKYTGLGDTLNTIFDESSAAYQNLFGIYTKYKDLIASNEGEAGASSDTTETTPSSTTPTTPDTPAVVAPPATTPTVNLSKPITKTKPILTPEQVASSVFSKKYPNYRGTDAPKILTEIKKIISYNNSNLSSGGSTALSWYIKGNKDWDSSSKYRAYLTAVTAMTKSTTTTPGYANGGLVPGFNSQGISAMLHGGEYVVNSNAVKNIGLSALQAMNDMRFNTPRSPNYAGPVQPQTTSTSTVNIHVDNFIGEKQWFESMMKDYNINVGPQNQKNAGLQNRTISTYNGLNRGL